MTLVCRLLPPGANSHSLQTAVWLHSNPGCARACSSVAQGAEEFGGMGLVSWGCGSMQGKAGGRRTWRLDKCLSVLTGVPLPLQKGKKWPLKWKEGNIMVKGGERRTEGPAVRGYDCKNSPASCIPSWKPRKPGYRFSRDALGLACPTQLSQAGKAKRQQPEFLCYYSV